MRYLRKWLALGAICLFTGIVNAQFIGLKTVPVATGDQGLVSPTKNLGIGGVAIALDDPYSDPFVNPAKGAQIQKIQLFSSPTYYNISDENGSALTMPLGVMVRHKNIFGGVMLSVQQMKEPPRQTFFWGPWIENSFVDGSALRNKQRHNFYAQGFLGKQISENTALGLGIAYSGLKAVEGTEFLYANSNSVEQSGRVWDMRLGLLSDRPSRQMEAVLFYHTYDMTQDAKYPYWWANPDPIFGYQNFEDITVHNRDLTRTMGLHLGYRQPINRETGWNIGGIFTANYKDHPKIPNYEIMNIPRDPGNTWAFNFGVGISRDFAPVRFGIDLIFEPVWSHTWANAESEMISGIGTIISAGNKTVENHFEFTNWIFRMGLEQHPINNVFGFQIGIEILQYQYWLDQDNYVVPFSRSQRESWMEWSPRIGLSWHFPTVEIGYTAKVTVGTGQPGLAFGNMFVSRAEFDTSDIILAPAGSLSLQEAHVLTHHITLAIPIN